MDDLLSELARHVKSHYYGKYRGFVVDNKDPERRGRVTLRVPSVLGDQVTAWALPCVPFAGWFAIPEKDAPVWVEFEEGDLRRPLWTGTYWQKKEQVPEEARAPEAPTTRVLQSTSGHRLQLDDEDRKERVLLRHQGGAELAIDPKGTVSLTDAKGATVVLDAENERIRIEDGHGNAVIMSSTGTVVEDANSNRIEMGPTGIKVKGQQIVIEGSQVMLGGAGGEPVIKGTTFLTLFATHVHTTALGPTSPPIPQGELSSLSTGVMAK